MKKALRFLVPLAIALAVIAGCGDGQGQISNTETQQTSPTVRNEPTPEPVSKTLAYVHSYDAEGGVYYSFSYDGNGLPLEISEYYYYNETPEFPHNNVVRTEFRYNSGRVENYTVTYDDSYSSDGSYSYDDQGNRIYSIFDNPMMGFVEENYAYDSQGRLTQVDLPANGVSYQYEYTDSGELAQKLEEGSDAEYYYRCITEPADHSYLPFAVNHFTNDAQLCDQYGNPLYSFYFNDPVYTADKDGYLAKVVDGTVTYEFFYGDGSDETDRFQDTCWTWGKGVTVGSQYVALFHSDGTFEYYKMNDSQYGTDSYQYHNGILYLEGIEYIWTGDRFISMQTFLVNGTDQPEPFKLIPDADQRFYQYGS